MRKDAWSDPSPAFCPLQIIHGGFPKEQEEIDLFLDDAEERSIGGFVINYPAPFGGGDPELTEAYMQAPQGFEDMRRFVRSAADRSFRLWLYDEAGYPSGSAGRLVYKRDPSFGAQGLLCRSCFAEGPCEGTLTLRPGGNNLLCAACPVTGEATEGEPLLSQTGMLPLQPGPEGLLRYRLPEGRWAVLQISAGAIDWRSDYGDPYIDLLNPQAAAAFVEVTHRKYEQELGTLLPCFEAIFTDEPSLPTHGCGSHFFETDPLVPWTPGLEKDFSQRFGYALLPEIWKLFFYSQDGDSRPRQDFWQWVGERFRDSFFDPIYRWSARTGVKSTGHLYGEESLSMQIALNGDLFGLFCRMQMPGVDRLYSTRPRDVIPEKTASSASHLAGCGEAMSESSFHFESNFWSLPISTEKMMETSSYQAVLGITQIASYYPYHIPGRHRYQQYMGRLFAFCRTGRHKAPVLCLIPMEEARRQYLPRPEKIWNIGPMPISPRATQGCRRIEAAYGSVLEGLLQRQLDFDLIDSAYFSRTSCTPQVLHSGQEEYSAVVAFAAGQPGDRVLEQLYEAAIHLVPVILVTIEGRPVCEDLLALHREYDDSVFFASVQDCPSLLAELLTIPDKRDFSFTSPTPQVWVRETITQEGERLFLLHNRGDRPAAVELETMPAGVPSIIDFSTGEIFEPQGRIENGRLFFTVEIPPRLARGAFVEPEPSEFTQ